MMVLVSVRSHGPSHHVGSRSPPKQLPPVWLGFHCCVELPFLDTPPMPTPDPTYGPLWEAGRQAGIWQACSYSEGGDPCTSPSMVFIWG